jgi:hypothetical protein
VTMVIGAARACVGCEASAKGRAWDQAQA